MSHLETNNTPFSSYHSITCDDYAIGSKTLIWSEVAPANQTEKRVGLANFQGRSPEWGSRTFKEGVWSGACELSGKESGSWFSTPPLSLSLSTGFPTQLANSVSNSSRKPRFLWFGLPGLLLIAETIMIRLWVHWLPRAVEFGSKFCQICLHPDRFQPSTPTPLTQARVWPPCWPDYHLTLSWLRPREVDFGSGCGQHLVWVKGGWGRSVTCLKTSSEGLDTTTTAACCVYGCVLVRIQKLNPRLLWVMLCLQHPKPTYPLLELEGKERFRGF